MAQRGRLGLGTVQFGLDYGVANESGQVSEDVARNIVDMAGASGLAVLDTAAFYGDSERVLGRIIEPDADFRIITKTAVVAGDKVEDGDIENFEATFSRSLANLNRDSVDGLLVHHGSDLLKPDGARLLDFLKEQKQKDRTRKIGVSVYSGAEIDGILDVMTPDIIQLPINMADQRLMESGRLKKLKDKGVEIHARSIFLQGVLLQQPEQLPGYLAPVRGRLHDIRDALQRQDFTPLEACLAFALQQKELDTVLVGVTGPDELRDIIDAVKRNEARSLDTDGLTLDDEAYLDPSQWRL